MRKPGLRFLTDELSPPSTRLQDISTLAVCVHPARSYSCPCRVSEREPLCHIMQGTLTEDVAKRSSGHIHCAQASAAHPSVATAAFADAQHSRLSPHLNTANWKSNSHFMALSKKSMPLKPKVNA